MTFAPENDLEDALMRAAKEPAARPLFYRLLLDSDLLVIGTIAGRPPSKGLSNVAVGESLQIASAERNGKPFHPVFSALSRLQSYVREEQGYLALNGRALFEATRGATFVLNPGSDYGKELLPHEIARLLDPAAVQPETITIQKPTSVRIGQPSVYPHALVNALKTSFAARPDVLEAYLAQIAYEGQPSHRLIGVETIGDWQSLSNEIGRVAAQAAPGEVLDVVRIDRSKPPETLAKSLLETTPFYVRPLPAA
jgi:hypothetical protein